MSFSEDDRSLNCSPPDFQRGGSTKRCLDVRCDEDETTCYSPSFWATTEARRRPARAPAPRRHAPTHTPTYSARKISLKDVKLDLLGMKDELDAIFDKDGIRASST